MGEAKRQKEAMTKNAMRDAMRRPLAGWVIGTWGGRTVLGRPAHLVVGDAVPPGVVDLEPAYEAVLQTVPTPQGLQLARVVLPIMSFHSVRRINTVTVLLAVDTLTTKEARSLEQGVQQCDEMIADIKANEAGIVPARDMPR
jgi:hypothetical protein